MAKVLYRQIKGYSGPVIYGDVIIPAPPPSAHHLQRAVWLNAEIETGNRMGSIMAADGTGMTAGDGYIAVYPKELADEDWNAKDDQGDLWPLLQCVIENSNSAFAFAVNVGRLVDNLALQGWTVAKDGTLRWKVGGRTKVRGRWLDYAPNDLVHGAIIRDTFTPIGGKVPKDGPQWEQAKTWALNFHRAFADELTFAAQDVFNQRHLMWRITEQKLKFNDLRRSSTMTQAIYGKAPVDWKVGRDISEAMDLALCVLHSFAINSPFYAYRALVYAVQVTGWRPVLMETASSFNFAMNIMIQIKATKYGNWTKRWDRTREAARKSGLWDAALFSSPNGIMTPR
jgi:hypothetical protein